MQRVAWLGFLPLLAITLVPGRALGDPAADAAAKANEVNLTYCGASYSSNVSLAADSTRRVAEVWGEVDQVYGETQTPYLLFWRGVLAQCLGRGESASEDLQAFLEWQKDDGGFDDLARQAQTRLRRLDRGKDLGTGPVARYLGGDTLLDLSLTWRGGGLLQSAICADDPDGGHLNTPCLGGKEVWKADEMPSLADVELGAALYFTRVLGASLLFDLAATGESTLGTEDGTYPGTAIGPRWSLRAGVSFRVQRPQAPRVRGTRLTLTPAFHLRHGVISSWAGNLTSSGQVIYYPGTYGWTRPGLALKIVLQVQLAPILALNVDLDGGIGLPTGAPTLVERQGPTEEVEILPDPAKLASAFAGGRFGPLIPLGEGKAALIPSVDIRWEGSTLRYPDDLVGDVWTVDVGTVEEPDLESRKVYSVHQHLLTVGAAIELRFGVPRPPR